MSSTQSKSSTSIALSLKRGSEKGKTIHVNKWLKEGRYEVLDIFAYGGMGVLLHAKDTRTFDHDVLIKAVKYVASEFAFDRQKALYNIYQLRQMFRRERRVICEIKNRGVNNIPSVNDFFYDHNPELASKDFPFGRLREHEDHAFLGLKMRVYEEPYMVMQWVRGTSLADCMAELPVLSVVRIVRDALVALSKMHEPRKRADGSTLQFVYLDLKPDNILVDRAGRMTLIDFGGAMPIVNGKKKREHKGALTHGYAAPELELLFSSLDEVDGRADLYAAGAILWRALTGKDPTLLADPVTDPFPCLPVDEIPSDAGPLKDVVARALERDVSARWTSAKDMVTALNRILQQKAAPP